MFETLLHINCKGLKLHRFQYYQSIKQIGSATIPRVLELIE